MQFLMYLQCVLEIAHAWADWHGRDDLTAYRWYIAIVA
jgi:hypothetical protein